MGEFSIFHWLVVLAVILMLFGGKRIPEIMKGFGEGIRSFKDGMAGVCDVPAMPSLKLRIPSPNPFMISGMRFPPKKIRTIARTISQCMGLSNMKRLHAPRLAARYHNPNAVSLLRQVTATGCTYRITRSSPARRVTRSRSRYSRRGMAYFRVMPVKSLKTGTVMRSPLDFLYADS